MAPYNLPRSTGTASAPENANVSVRINVVTSTKNSVGGPKKWLRGIWYGGSSKKPQGKTLKLESYQLSVQDGPSQSFDVL